MSGSNSSNPDAAAEPALPSSPLAMTVHSLPTLDPQARQRRAGRLQLLLVVLVCAAPVLASYFSYYVWRPAGGANAYGELAEPPRAMPEEVPALDLDGAAHSLRELKGQWLLVTVDSGRCDSACEQRLYLQRQLREMTGRDRDRIDKLWLLADDAPVRPALRQALEASPAMLVRRLPRAAIEAWLVPAPGQRLEDHLYLVDPLGQWMMRMPVSPEPARVKRDLERLLRAAASWDQPGRQGLANAAPAGASGPVALPAVTRTPAPALAPASR